VDTAILDAAIEVVAEVGYDRMTMDMVAQRAKAGKAAVYRRWKSKADVIIDAVAHLKRMQVDLDALPDTGTLRGDLLGLFKPSTAREGERKMRVMAGLASVLSQHPELAEAGNAAIVEPWASANLRLMERAVARGEVKAVADIITASQVMPSMAAYRALIQRKPFELQFLTSVIDGVLLPALGITAAVSSNPSNPQQKAPSA
jgi:AcrR family transcriptional regulator